MDRKAFHIVLLVASILTLVYADCALPEEVYPCKCSLRVLQCGNVNEAQLRAVFGAQKEQPGDISLGRIYFGDYRMSYIPSGLLSGLDVYELDVNTPSLLSFHDPHTGKSAIAGVEKKLRRLYLSYYGITSNHFDWNSLSPLEELEILHLSGSFAAILTPLPLLPKLESFTLRDTRIKFINENAFVGFTGVKSIYIKDNLINAPARNMFPNPAWKLSNFAILSDGLVVLPEDFFEGMPILEKVFIIGNASYVPPLHSTVLTSLAVAGGNLTCDCKLKWLPHMRDEGKVNIYHSACARPEHLRSRDPQTLTEQDLMTGGSCDSS